MKTLVFIFRSTSYQSQLTFAFDHLLTRSSQILLIRILPDSFFNTHFYNLKDSDVKKKRATKLLNDIKIKILSFRYDLDVECVVVLGNEYAKIRPILKAVKPYLVVFGKEEGWSFGKSLERWINEEVGIPVVKVCENYMNENG